MALIYFIEKGSAIRRPFSLVFALLRTIGSQDTKLSSVPPSPLTLKMTLLIHCRLEWHKLPIGIA